MARRSDYSKVTKDESGLERDRRRLGLRPGTVVCCEPSRPARLVRGLAPPTGSQDHPSGSEVRLPRHPFHLTETQRLAAVTSSCVRMERVARIRASIATGTYHVSAEEVARSLVTHLLRGSGQP